MSAEEKIQLTRQQKVIRVHLAKVVARYTVVNYSDLCRVCHLPYSMDNPDHRAKLGHDLGAISVQEVLDFDRPMLSSVTVSFNGGSMRPDNGSFNLADEFYDYDDKEEFFYSEMNDPHNFWSSPEGKLEIAKMEKEVLKDSFI